MNLLPNFQNAVIPVERLEDYVLNSEHPKGARVFRERLNIERRHAGVLAELIRAGLPKAPAERRDTNEYGDVWTTWHAINGLNAQSAIVTVAWMFKKNAEDTPVLISCYISCYIQTREQERLRRLVSLG
jgi:hypothetical protein